MIDKSVLDYLLSLGARDIICDVPAVVLPAGASVHSLESFNDHPNRHKGCYSTSVLHDFLVYCENNFEVSSAVYVDGDTMIAKAIFDHGSRLNPLWGTHIAKLAISRMPAFNAVISKNRIAFSQSDFIDFINDWSGNIKFFKDGASMPISVALAQFRKLTISNIKNSEFEHKEFSSSKSAMESIDIGSVSGIPDVMTFDCVTYDGFFERNIVCDIRAVGDLKGVTLSYRVQGKEELESDIVTEFIGYIRDGCDVAPVYIGTMAR